MPQMAMLIGACVRHHEVRLAAGEDPSAQPGMGRSARSACPARLAGPRRSGDETGSAAAAQGMPEPGVLLGVQVWSSLRLQGCISNAIQGWWSYVYEPDGPRKGPLSN